MVDPTERFVEIVQQPAHDVALDEAALLIAAHDHAVDVAEQMGRLDALAVHAPPNPEALASYLFVEHGFTGNTVDYGEPENSFLDVVLDRRLGIPITLSVLMMEVGRRAGVALEGVGMPGHFLVRSEPGIFFDPFNGGERLDADGAHARFTAVQGDATFAPEFLEPVDAHAILGRMLANLVRTLVSRAPAHALWAVRLRLRVPGLSPSERREIATLLGSLGQFAEAATELDAIAQDLDGDAAGRLGRDAAAYRARAN